MKVKIACVDTSINMISQSIHQQVITTIGHWISIGERFTMTTKVQFFQEKAIERLCNFSVFHMRKLK